jgi:hypothetical protein
VWNAAGQPGADGVSGYEVVGKRDSRTFNTGDIIGFDDSVSCPAGKVAIGGGADAVQSRLAVVTSRPSLPDHGRSTEWFGSWALNYRCGRRRTSQRPTGR